MCEKKNAFLTYKVNRVDILSDKEAKQQKKEPFHLKYLREEAEKKKNIRDEKKRINEELKREQERYEQIHESEVEIFIAKNSDGESQIGIQYEDVEVQ